MQYIVNNTSATTQPVKLKPDTVAKQPSQISASDYEEVPCGYYQCFINGCERMQSKTGKPMLKVTLKIAKACDVKNAKFEGRYMWVYQMTTSEYGERIAQEWEQIAEHFPHTPVKVSKYMKKSKAGNEFTNYRVWLSEKQEESLYA